MQHRFKASNDRSRMNGEASDDELHHPEAHVSPAVRIPRLPGIATQLIGERMRAMYTTLVDEPVPDDLLNLVRQLETKERSE